MADTKTKKITRTTSKTKAARPAVKTAEKKVVAKIAPKTVKEAKVGISVNVYGMDGKPSGKITLPGEIFGAKVNPILMAQAVRVYAFSQRQGHASTKTRGEVRGTTKKMYRQKGTGRARHGAAKAPIFVGGGITFGPRPRDFSLDFPKKMKRASLFSSLASKLQEEKVKVLDLSSATGKTQEVVKVLQNLDLISKNGNAKKVMIVVPNDSKMVVRASKNIDGAMLKNAANLTTYEVLNSNMILFMKESIEALKNTYLKSKKQS
ncbi:MAG: 50S ribosomal protein L4 [Candidatus Levyibacteriota bacterium]